MDLSPTPQRLKIAFVVDRFGNRYGGAEAYGVELMRELAQRHDITVIARQYDPQCDVKLPFVPLASPRGLPSWVRVLAFAIRARQATRRGFDVVHSHMSGFCGDIEVIHVTPVGFNWRVRSLPFLKRAMSYISPRVQTYLGLERARVRPRPGHRVVGVSRLIADQLRMAYGSGQDFKVIAPGVSSPSVSDRLRVSTRKELGYTETDWVCLLVARNPLRKGLPTVLKALAELPDRYKLLVVGANPAARDYFQQCIESPALTGRVTLLDATSDVAPYFQAADLYVHPTLNDSFGMAPLEAMSHGLPVILSPAPWCGFADYVEPGCEALLLPHPEAHEALRTDIERVANDPQLRQTLKSGGAAVADRHSWAEVARQYEALYAQCLAEKAKPQSARDDLQVQ